MRNHSVSRPRFSAERRILLITKDYKVHTITSLLRHFISITPFLGSM
jgi:hypothetical protein